MADPWPAAAARAAVATNHEACQGFEWPLDKVAAAASMPALVAAGLVAAAGLEAVALIWSGKYFGSVQVLVEKMSSDIKPGHLKLLEMQL